MSAKISEKFAKFSQKSAVSSGEMSAIILRKFCENSVENFTKNGSFKWGYECDNFAIILRKFHECDVKLMIAAF